MKTKLAVLFGAALFFAGCNSSEDATIADRSGDSYNRDYATPPAVTSTNDASQTMASKKPSSSDRSGQLSARYDTGPYGESDTDSLDSQSSPESASTNLDQPESASANLDQPESASANLDQPESASANLAQPESASANLDQDESALTEPGQDESPSARLSQFDPSTEGQADQLSTEQPEEESAIADASNAPSEMPAAQMTAKTGVVKASEFIGRDVTNSQDESLGSIEDLAIDLETGRVAYVALSSGGFLGVGDKLIAVPLETLSMENEGEGASEEMKIMLAASKEQIENAEGFSTENWPESPTQAWGASSATQPSNSEFDSPDGGGSAALQDSEENPEDLDLTIVGHSVQTGKSGSSEKAATHEESAGSTNESEASQDVADRNLTLHIRKDLETDKEIATLAKNVKVAVQDDKVKLTGEVKSNEEKKEIENRVREMIGRSLDIQNDLKVQEQK